MQISVGVLLFYLCAPRCTACRASGHACSCAADKCLLRLALSAQLCTVSLEGCDLMHQYPSLGPSCNVVQQHTGHINYVC